MIRRGIGVQSFVSAGGGTDADAQAFITAAGITDATQQSAINTLVTDLKGYGIWSKMKAIYPFVGGTSSTHKWNLKDPRDLDAAFRLVFTGGSTHASTGWTPNGVNGYADTFLTPSTSLLVSSAHFAKYNRNNDLSGNKIDGTLVSPSFFQQNYSAGNAIVGDVSSIVSYTQTDTRGLFTATRTSSNTVKVFKNNLQQGSTNTSASSTLPNFKVYLGARNDNNAATFYNSYECAFASIGDGLTDTEASNLYTAVQKYQTTLGRSVGTQTVSDSDAQAFVNAAVIEDQVQAAAINTLVTDLKTYGIWSKMKAVYPFVGYNASQNKWNLKDPRDLDGAYRLVFNGGWTHDNGARPNGVNGYANTYFNLTNLTVNSGGATVYRNLVNNGGSDIATYAGGNFNVFYNTWSASSGGVATVCAYSFSGTLSYADPTGLGLYTTNALNGTTKGYRNGITKLTNTTQGSPASVNSEIGRNTYGVEYSDSRYGFVAYHDGLTDTEAANLYTAVQAYQTSLNRQV